MNLAIRRAVPTDETVLVEFNLAIAWETEHKRLNRDVLTVGVRAVFADAARGFYTVAENDRGEVVGQMMVTYEWSDWRNGTVIWVQSVYVPPELRGSGIYRRLYEHLRERVLASPELMGIRLYVDRRNTAAQRVYERLGMSREHYETFEWLK